MLDLQKKNVFIDSRLNQALNEIGLIEYENFRDDNVGTILRRDSYHREVRLLDVKIDGHLQQLYLKRVGREPLTHSIRMLIQGRYPESSPMREKLLLRSMQQEGFPVMDVVAWGEERRFGFPVSGFLIAEKVHGDEVAKIYDTLSSDEQALLFRSIGSLLGNLHLAGFFQQVRLTDLICRYEKNKNRFCLTLIDRETGKPWKTFFTKQKCINSLARSLRRTIRYHMPLEPDVIEHLVSGYLAKCGQKLKLSKPEFLARVNRKIDQESKN